LYKDDLINELAQKAKQEVINFISCVDRTMPFRTEIHIKLKESYKIKKWKRLDIQALKV